MKGQDTMIYVGIDVASNKHDCFIMRDTGEVFSEKSFINPKLKFTICKLKMS